MTTYTAIPDSDIDPESPGTTTLFTRLRNNPIAITEGASGAPQIQGAAIATGAVGQTQMAANAVSTVVIVDGNVTTAKLASGEQMTTANVAGAMAGVAVGAVGSYAFLGENATNTTTVPGGTRAGSDLRHVGITATSQWAATGLSISGSGTTASIPTGTWRAMGYSYGTTSAYGATLWLRIS